MRHTLCTLSIALCAVASCRRPADVATQVSPALADRILSALVGSAHIDADSTASPEIRKAITAYNARSAAYQPKQRTSSLAEFGMIAPVWAAYERRLAAISTAPNADSLAQAYVDSLRPPYEWEGLHDGPEAEARFADVYRTNHPSVPFRDLLLLLGAHRWKCAEEAYRGERKPDEAERSRKAFAGDVQMAVGSFDVLVRTAALRLAARGTCTP